MIESAHRRRLSGMVIYTLIMLALLLIRLAPFSVGRPFLPGPDFALCLTLAWILRRPEQVPALLIAAIFLCYDLMLMRPPGLMTAIIVMATEAARAREPRWRELPFVVEWLRVALLLAMMIIAYRIAMAVMLVPQPTLGQSILQLVATVLAYPVTVVAARWLFGLRRVDHMEAERS